MSKKRAGVVVFAAGSALLGATSVSSADVISGTVIERVGTNPFAKMTDPPIVRGFEVGDGVNHVTIVPQFGAYFAWDTSLYFYGSHVSNTGTMDLHDTDVSFVPGATDITQITDASTHTFISGSYFDSMGATDYVQTGPAPDGYVMKEQGIMLLRNNETGHYGAVIYRDAHDYILGGNPDYGLFSAVVELEWYFQTDGSGDFSTPTPGTLGMLAMIGGAGCIRRRRK